MDIPSGWESFQLKDVTHESRMRAASVSATHLVVFGVNNQTGLSTESKYHAENLDRYKIVKPGMFAYNPMRLNIGSIGYCNEEIGEGLVSPDYVVFGCKESRLDSKYFSYYIQGHQWRHWVQRAGAGSVRIRIYYEDIGIYPIILPPLQEQCKIVEILSTWDEAIAKTEQLIDALQQRKKGLMQRLLTGEVRFLGFDGKWKIDDLGKYANVRRGASPRPITNPAYFAKHGRGWIRISDATSEPSRFLTVTSQYLSELGESKSVKVEVGDLIMSICATIGVPKIVNIPACIHDGFVLFSDYEQMFNKEFLYHYIDFITPRLASGGQPGTQRNLNTSIVRKIKIPIISLTEQRKIVETLNICDKEIELQSKKLAALQQQKKGLMQRLLTGQVRVKV